MSTIRDVSSEPLPALAPRASNSHKGDYGRLLLIGGSRGMAGSIAMAGMAALRSGAGLVTIATPQCVQPTVASFSPVYMTLGLPDDGDTFAMAAIDPLLEHAAMADAIAIGPGLGRNATVQNLVARCYAELPQPMVVDADALNALAAMTDHRLQPAGPRVWTPHPGEYQRLTGEKVTSEEDARITAATNFASADDTGQTIVILKGHRTVIAAKERYAMNTTGNPGMATGGVGDVLSGILAALLGQGLDPWSSARLGVARHGQAGDLAAEKMGQVSLIATDLIDQLPAAFGLPR